MRVRQTRSPHRFRTEAEFVQWLRRQTTVAARALRLGIGDDAALVRPARNRDVVLKADLSIEGVHFARDIHPARAVGHRALARPLSDVAAMGGTPRFALLSLAMTEEVNRAWIEQFYAGFRALAERAGVALIGGDTAISPAQMMADVMVVGEVPRARALRRSGARPGDQIFVTGRLGASALGLRLLRSPRHSGRAPQARAAVRAHLYPEPRCALGRYLLAHRLASACIDISDGLSIDLHHLCEASRVGAWVWEELIPTAGGPLASRPEALSLALEGGEDYELLFTVPPRWAGRVPARWAGVPLTRLGEIRRPRGVTLIAADGHARTLQPSGYDHFRPRSPRSARPASQKASAGAGLEASSRRRTGDRTPHAAHQLGQLGASPMKL